MNLFEPQEQSIKAGLFDDKKNFLITIPTASGKTLIAMLSNSFTSFESIKLKLFILLHYVH